MTGTALLEHQGDLFAEQRVRAEQIAQGRQLTAGLEEMARRFAGSNFAQQAPQLRQQFAAVGRRLQQQVAQIGLALLRARQKFLHAGLEQAHDEQAAQRLLELTATEQSEPVADRCTTATLRPAQLLRQLRTVRTPNAPNVRVCDERAQVMTE